MALLCTPAAQAESLRLALWNVGLERRGPGLLLRDIEKGTDPQVMATLAVLARLDADILVLTGVDHDPGLHALAALAMSLQSVGQPYPHLFAPRPNSGQPTGFDVDGDGRLNEPEDAQGWGRFPGAGGTAILSRLPLLPGQAQDFSAFLWRDLPQAGIPPGTDPSLVAVQRLSSHSHLILPVQLPDGSPLPLLIWHATPPPLTTQGIGMATETRMRLHSGCIFWMAILRSGPRLNPLSCWVMPTLTRWMVMAEQRPCAPF